MNKCGTCRYYIGGGDWNLCCSISHPTPEEKIKGMTYTYGHLCYKNTEACDMYMLKDGDNKEGRENK